MADQDLIKNFKSININNNIAILICCFNRKEKTLQCLESVFSQVVQDFQITVYLMDNGSDGTYEKVNELFPQVKLSSGNDNLFWAGSMRRIWKSAINSPIIYDFFLLLNDDTFLINTALKDLLFDMQKLSTKEVILIGSTLDPITKNISYGGKLLVNNYGKMTKPLIPNNSYPQLCHIGNGNIMLVPTQVVKKIGILSDLYTHGIADFDYTLRARKMGISSYITSSYSGFCQNDHGNKWWPASKFTLKQRIKSMYNVKGLAYKEYLLYLKIHFPFYLPYAFLMLWVKTLFPFLWEKFKRKN